MEENVTERELAGYLEKRRCGGRSAFARLADYVLLRAVFFAGAYLFFAGRLARRGPAVALSCIALGLLMLLLRVLRELSRERFLAREHVRIRNLLLTDKLLLLDPEQAADLCRPLCGPGETPLLLQQAGPAGADALLSLIRNNRHAGRLSVFCCGGFDGSAEALALRAGGQVTLRPKDALLDAAKSAGLSPSAGEIRACLAAEVRAARKKRRKGFPSPRQPHAARKYFFAALLLTLCSFFTRYALYYRLLAGLCSAAATVGLVLRASAKNAS